MKKKQKKTESDPLKIQKAVPALRGIDWVHGEKITIGKSVTLLKFWAAWHEPSHEYLTTLTEVQKKYESRITVAALSAEEAEDVESFIKKKEKQIEYSIGCAPARLYQNYLNGKGRIPVCFVINEEGLLVWNGHPSEVEKILELVLDEERSQASLIKTFIKKEKFLEIFEDIKNGGSEKLNRKSKMKTLAKDYLEVFPEDKDALEILENYPTLLPGEKCPEFGNAAWIKDKADLASGYRLIDFWDLQNGDSLGTFPYISAIHKKFKNKLTVVGLTKDSAPIGEINEFMERHTEDISYPVGAIPDEIFKAYLPDEDAWMGKTVLLNSDNVLLWTGKAEHAVFIISHLFEKDGTEKDILDFSSDREMFIRMNEEFQENGSGDSEEDFKKLMKLGENVLKINPTDMDIPSILSAYARNLGYESVKSVCGIVNLSKLNADQILPLITDLQQGNKDVWPFEFIFECMERVLKLDPSVSNILQYADILKNAHKLDLAMEYCEKALEYNEQTEEIERKKAEILNMKKAAEFAKGVSEILK